MKIDDRLVLLLLLVGCAGTRAPDPDQVALVEFSVTVTGRGPPVILIPGLASSGQVWDGVVAELSATHACHVLTLAGFAGTPPIAPPLLDQFREALAHYIVDRGLARPAIVGHSLGGVLALDLAAQHPDLTGPLLIVDALPFLPAASDPQATPASVLPQAQAFARQLVNTPAAELRSSERQTLATLIRDPDKIELALDWFMRSDLPTVAAAMVELMTTDLRPELGRIQRPVRVVGTWFTDTASGTSVQAQARFAAQYAALPGVQIVMADGARHFVMFDDLPFLLAQLAEVLGQP